MTSERLYYEAFLQQYVLAHIRSQKPTPTDANEAKWLVERAHEAYVAIEAKLPKPPGNAL